MDKIETQIVDDKKIWEDFISIHPETNFLQSWSWGEFQESLGRKIFRVGFKEGAKLIGIMFAYVEPSKRGKLLILPGGPIIEWGNEDLVKQFGNKLKELTQQNGCMAARVRPQLIDDPFSRKIFEDLGFKNAPMYLHAELTSQLDIKPSEDELLANMRKATRYEIKKAIKLGIEISTSNDEKTFREFYKIQMDTAKRQKFVPFSENFLLKQFNIFINNGEAILYTAKHEGKVLAQAFIIFYGEEAVYHYGASTDEGRRFPGAYLIQWEALREAKKRGMSRYNFWGVAPIEETTHRFSGISIFKRGFGGQDVKYLQAQDLVTDQGRYLFNYWIEKIRRHIRHS